jgi:hypothetical protein
MHWRAMKNSLCKPFAYDKQRCCCTPIHSYCRLRQRSQVDSSQTTAASNTSLTNKTRIPQQRCPDATSSRCVTVQLCMHMTQTRRQQLCRRPSHPQQQHLRLLCRLFQPARCEQAACRQAAGHPMTAGGAAAAATHRMQPCLACSCSPPHMSAACPGSGCCCGAPDSPLLVPPGPVLAPTRRLDALVAAWRVVCWLEVVQAVLRGPGPH